jgi:hypothetical protein
MTSRDSQTRGLIAREAARLMYEEQVDQYFTAKRMAAKRLFGVAGAKQMRFRPSDLPSNGEIQAALLRLAKMVEGDARTDRLGAMRRCAVTVMRQLFQFEPRLIGSVSTGHVRRGSDIDLHLFSDDADAPEAALRELGWAYEKEIAQIRRGNSWFDYLHLHVDASFPVELTVYPRGDLRHRPRSSTDGKPIERLSLAGVLSLIDREHPNLAAELAQDDHVHL